MTKTWDQIKREKGVPEDYRTPLSNADFGGESYDAERDGERLHKQLRAVRDLMIDGRWRSLSDIEWGLLGASYPQASISARLRDLRKRKYGSYTVERRYAGDGLWEYRVSR